MAAGRRNNKKKFPKATPVKVVKIISGIYRKKTSEYHNIIRAWPCDVVLAIHYKRGTKNKSKKITLKQTITFIFQLTPYLRSLMLVNLLRNT